MTKNRYVIVQTTRTTGWSAMTVTANGRTYTNRKIAEKICKQHFPIYNDSSGWSVTFQVMRLV